MSKNKTIWIINQYASTPQTGMGGRHYSMACELVKMGYNVYLIAANQTHILRKPLDFSESFKIQKQSGVNFLWIKVPTYPTANSKKRILNWFLFCWKILSLDRIIKDKPDAILYSSPSLIGFLGAHRLAKKLKVPFTFEVRDIWPLSLSEIGNYSKNHPFIVFLQWIENKAYKESDNIISNLKNAKDHMIKYGLSAEKFTWIPNGFFREEVSQPEPIDIETESLLPRDKFIIGYTGAIGNANALDNLINAAEKLKNQSNIIFVIVGTGSEEKNLKDTVRKKNLINVIFIDPIPKIQIQSVLQKFDVCYIGLTDAPLFKYGVSPNKLFDYLYAKKPVLYAIDSGQYQPIVEFNAGFQIKPDDKEELVNAILKMYHLSKDDRIKMGMRGYNNVINNHEYSVLAKKLADVLFDT